MKIKEKYDWQKFIADSPKDKDGRITLPEDSSEYKEHFLKMREVNKDTNWEEIKSRFADKPKDKDGYIIITEEDRDRARKIVNWVDNDNPNCKFMPFVEQDKISKKARKALNC